MKRGYADTPHGQIHYQAAGSGEPVVMLHQVPTSGEEFTLAMPFLAKEVRAIAMDIIGYGNSDKPPRRYNMADYARSVVDFLDALHVERAHLVGHHTGAGITAEVAAAYPDRVRTLVVSGFPLFTDEELALRRSGEIPVFLRKSEPLVYKPDGSHLTDVWEQTMRISAFGQAKVESRNDPEWLEATHDISLAMLKSGPRNIEGHLALWRWETRRRLPLIRRPTLILMTTEDQFCDRAEAIRALIPGSRVLIEKGGGSYFPRQAPQRFAAAILDFLRSNWD